jgi:type I restriction enzyme S subunit
MKLYPYPAYKDSGVDWLGRVPDHWKVERLKSFVQRVITGVWGAEAQGNDNDMICVRVADFDYQRLGVARTKFTTRNIPRADQEGRLLHQGAILIERSGGGEISSVGRVVQFDHKDRSVTSNFISQLVTAPSVDNRFLCYVFASAYAVSLNTRSINQTTGIQNIDLYAYLSERFPVPPLAEQKVIAIFLDQQSAQAQRLIRAKRRLIALLNEQKQAIIQRAVTRGLDPDVPLKPSGVEWLGDIPKHWRLRRFKFLANITSGQVDPRQDPYRDYILIAPNHIERNTGRLLLEESAGAQGADSGKYFAKKGEVLYSKIRPNLRKAVIAPRDCLCSADMYPIAPKHNDLRSEFLLLLLLSEPFTKYAVDYSMRVAMPKVNREALGNCWLWYPDLAEQELILHRLSLDLSPLEGAINRAQREIELIREYRTRLIADVVTGKLDVRRVQLPDVQEASDLVSLDDSEEAGEAEAGELELEPTMEV